MPLAVILNSGQWFIPMLVGVSFAPLRSKAAREDALGQQFLALGLAKMYKKLIENAKLRQKTDRDVGMFRCRFIF